MNASTTAARNLALLSNSAGRFFLLRLYTTNQGGARITIWSAQNNATVWTQRGDFQLPNTTQFEYRLSASLAADGANMLLAVSVDQVHKRLFRSTNTGQSWSAVSNAPAVRWVTFGRGMFLGSGNNGVWTSPTGQSWTKQTGDYVDEVAYSPQLDLFFSVKGGLSRDGKWWNPVGESDRFGMFYSYGRLVVGRTNNLVFYSGSMASPTFIPTFFAPPSRRGKVNEEMNFTFRTD